MAAFFKKHPHVRGEDAQGRDAVQVLLETPPRAWGRLAHQITALVLDGNTPTCVGKTPRVYTPQIPF